VSLIWCGKQHPAGRFDHICGFSAWCLQSQCNGKVHSATRLPRQPCTSKHTDRSWYEQSCSAIALLSLLTRAAIQRYRTSSETHAREIDWCGSTPSPGCRAPRRTSKQPWLYYLSRRAASQYADFAWCTLLTARSDGRRKEQHHAVDRAATWELCFGRGYRAERGIASAPGLRHWFDVRLHEDILRQRVSDYVVVGSMIRT